VNTNTQILFNDFTTSRTSLCSVFGINLNQRSTSVFSFVREKIKELSPCCVIYMPVQNLKIVLDHLFRLKFFNINTPKLVNYFPAKFMLKIFTLVTNFFMQTSKLSFQALTSLFRILTLRLKIKILYPV